MNSQNLRAAILKNLRPTQPANGQATEKSRAPMPTDRRPRSVTLYG